MPVKYVVLNNGNLVLERWVGTISHNELLDNETRQVKDTSIKPGAVALAYAVDAVFPETTLDKIHEIAEIQGSPDNPVRFSKVALLVNEKTWQQGKKLEQLMADTGISYIMFTSIHIACTWLGIDTDKTLETIHNLVAEKVI